LFPDRSDPPLLLERLVIRSRSGRCPFGSQPAAE
jgi:hypothetical protein